METLWINLGPILENDGEVAVCIPFATHSKGGWFKLKNGRHTCIRRRVGMAPEQFLALYPVMDGAAEVTAQKLKDIGATEEEMREAMLMARFRDKEFQNLLRLIRAVRVNSLRSQFSATVQR